MSDNVTTTNAGNIDSNVSRDRRKDLLVGVLLAFIVAPFTALAGVTTWLAFSRWRYRRSVISVFLAGWVILISSWSVPLSLNWFQQSFNDNIVDSFTPAEILLPYFVLQFTLGVPVGIILGLIYCSWRWYQRAEWEKYDFRITPWELHRGRKTAEDIRLDKNTPLNGLTLGINEHGDRVIQTDIDAALHTIMVGASGSGKTVTLLTRARDSIKRGQGMVFVDLKGGPEVPEVLSKFAKRYGRNFSHWTLQPRDAEYTGPDPLGPAYYDPLARGEATRRKDLIIGSRPWSEEFYKIEASNYLQLLFYVAIANPAPNVSILSDVVTLLNPRALLQRAKPIMNDPKYADIIAGIDALNDERISPQKRNAIEGLRSQLSVILNSIAGQWLNVDPNGHNINLKETAHNGDIVVFSLDSNNYPELSSLVANLIIQDLKTVTSELMYDPSPQPMQIFIDEFSAIGSDNIVGLINKSREAKLPITLATQAKGDMVKVDKSFLDQLIGIVSCYIIHRANSEEDATLFAGLTGTTKRKKFSQNVDHQRSRWSGMSRGAGTGGGRVEEVEEYLVTPNEIQQLGMGEMIYIAKGRQPVYVEYVTVIPEEIVEDMDYEESITPAVKNENTDEQNLQPIISTPYIETVETVNVKEDENVNISEIITPKTEEGRLSDPAKLASILNNNEDVTVSQTLPVRPSLPTAPVVERKTTLNVKPVIPSKPILDASKNEEPASKEKDEFEF